MSTINQTSGTESDPTCGERPESRSLRNVPVLAAEMVRHFKDKVAGARALPQDALNGDITAVTVNCLRIVATILDGGDTPTEREVAQLESAAAQWARDGIPVDIILHALHEGSKMAHGLVTSQSADSGERIDIGSRTVDLLNLMTTTVTMAYLREFHAAAGENHNAVHTLASAVLNGRMTTGLARECGIAVSASYYVVAVSLPPHPSESGSGLDHRIVARRTLRRVRSELAVQCGKECLSLLSVAGGTVLVPVKSTSEERLARLFDGLSRVAEVPVTAVFIESDVADIPKLVTTLHEMLDIAIRLQVALHSDPETRLFRFDELAAEYQLTRPGPVRETLARKMEPLADHSELLETLRIYLASDQSRQKTARRLHLHPNTVDYRLKRISLVTGMDPTRAEGQWGLRSALIAGVAPTVGAPE